MKTPLYGPEKTPIMRDGNPLTIEQVAVDALLYPCQGDSPDLKLKKYLLYKKVADGVLLSVQDKALILEAAGIALPALFYGQLHDFLNA